MWWQSAAPRPPRSAPAAADAARGRFKAPNADDAAEWIEQILHRRNHFRHRGGSSDSSDSDDSGGRSRKKSKKKKKAKKARKPVPKPTPRRRMTAANFTDSEEDSVDSDDSDSDRRRRGAGRHGGKHPARTKPEPSGGGSDTSSMASDISLSDSEMSVPPPPELEGWLAKRSPSKFKKWQDRYFKLENGTLYYLSSEDAAEHSGAIEVRKISMVREAEGSKTRKKFEVVSPYRTFSLKAATRADMRRWVQTLRSAMEHERLYGKSKPSKSKKSAGADDDTSSDDSDDDDELDDPSYPVWLREFLRSSDEEQILSIQSTLNGVFVDTDGDLTKVTNAATTLVEDLEDKAAECKGRKQFVALSTHVRFYHMKLVAEVSYFTSADEMKKLSPEQLVRLLDWIRAYELTRRRVLKGVPAELVETLPPFDLVDDAKTLVNRYMELMGPQLEKYVLQIARNVSSSGLKGVEMKTKKRLGTNAPQDLFNLLNENLTVAKEGGSLALQRKLLCAVMANVCNYQLNVVFDIEGRMEAAKQAAKRKKETGQQDGPVPVEMDYVCAIVNDTGVILDHIELLETSFGPAVDPTLIDSDSESDEEASGDAKDEDAEGDLVAIRSDIPRAKKELIKGALKACDVLIDIVLQDVQELLDQLFFPYPDWVRGEHMMEIAATVADYFTDFRDFLDNYFFQRLVVKALEKLSLLYVQKLFATAGKKGSVKSLVKRRFGKAFALDVEERGGLWRLERDIQELRDECFAKVLDEGLVDKGLHVLMTAKDFLSIPLGPDGSDAELIQRLTDEMVMLRSHSAFVYMVFEQCVNIRGDLTPQQRRALTGRAQRALVITGEPPDPFSMASIVANDEVSSQLISEKLHRRIYEKMFGLEEPQAKADKLFADDMLKMTAAAEQAKAVASGKEITRTLSLADFLSGGDTEGPGLALGSGSVVAGGAGGSGGGPQSMSLAAFAAPALNEADEHSDDASTASPQDVDAGMKELDALLEEDGSDLSTVTASIDEDAPAADASTDSSDSDSDVDTGKKSAAEQLVARKLAAQKAGGGGKHNAVAAAESSDSSSDSDSSTARRKMKRSTSSRKTPAKKGKRRGRGRSDSDSSADSSSSDNSIDNRKRGGRSGKPSKAVRASAAKRKTRRPAADSASDVSDSDLDIEPVGSGGCGCAVQ